MCMLCKCLFEFNYVGVVCVIYKYNACIHINAKNCKAMQHFVLLQYCWAKLLRI